MMKCEKITLKSGQTRWECVADGPRHPATGKRNQITRRGKTQKEAKNKVLTEIRSLEDTHVNKKYTRKMTFDEVADKWLEVYELTGKKKNTLRIRRQEVSVLNKHIAKMPISNINHATYQEVINNITPNRARTTVQNINTTANMVFKYAKRNHLITENPATDVVIPKKRKTIEEIRENNIEEKYLEHHELNEFFEAVEKHGLKYDKERFYTLAFSGMRSGELCALQKSDLDFEQNTIDINKTIYNEKNNMKDYELTPPKTDGSIRQITVEEPVMKILKEVVVNNDKHKMQFRTLIEDFHDKDFVFSRPNGYPFVTKTILIRMDRLISKTSIKKHATPHIFRHTHISMLAEAGVDIATVMKKVGHEDIDTTMRIYTHVTDKMKKDASEKISNLYGNILEKI
ncbi:tyrosine-type recombinase/integrase [Virgibacillus salexigens]|uniref:Tyrosine recombinase XerC n=2 Tax=Virgibacillus massiliensis TaxID=1462526 RepID=A0A024QH26_9BACI|nr:tyrosine-type recombinase/integrase [Virgibacillus massiliensis]CDQ41465.1 Tyrosine recombinase XerC [Virgibacillus massiliensis]